MGGIRLCKHIPKKGLVAEKYFKFCIGGQKLFIKNLISLNYLTTITILIFLNSPASILAGQLESIEDSSLKDNNNNNNNNFGLDPPPNHPPNYSPGLLIIKEEFNCAQRTSTHVWDPIIQKCFAKPSNDSDVPLLQFRCRSDLQCIHSSLGILSRCNPKAGVCECYHRESEGRIPTIFYEGTGKCYRQKHLEDFCSEDAECKAGIHPVAECSNHPSFLPHEKICTCPAGKSCKNLDDNCLTDKECREGINRYAVCRFHIGENVCTCLDGHICIYGVNEAYNTWDWSSWQIAGIVIGTVVATLSIISVIVVMFLRSRKTRYPV